MRRLSAALALLVLASCSLPPARTATEAASATLTSLRVPLGVSGHQLAEGVSYAGGLSLRGGRDFHALSDLKLHEGRLWSVADEGRLVSFRPVLDTPGRLIGVADARVSPLTDAEGQPLTDKRDADSEGLAILDDGRVLVSFERHHRIWSYGTDAAALPVAVATPEARFRDNDGLEGLAAAGPDQWVTAGQDGGVWLCGSAGCTALPRAEKDRSGDYQLTGMDRDPRSAGGEAGWFIVERRFTPPFNTRVRVRRMGRDGSLGPVLIDLRPPASVDNFEGIAAVATPGGTRLYLLSDDNGSARQKTLLMAFDVSGEPALRPVQTP